MTETHLGFFCQSHCSPTHRETSLALGERWQAAIFVDFSNPGLKGLCHGWLVRFVDH